MINRTARQATSATLASIVTLAMLLSVNGLAQQPHTEAVMAKSAAQTPTQVVTVVGQRAARG
jgi:hypothetical protein